MTSKLEAVIGVWLSGGEQRLQNCGCDSCVMDPGLSVCGEGGVFAAQGEGSARFSNALFSPKYSVGISVGKVSNINLKYSSAWFLPVENCKSGPLV